MHINDKITIHQAIALYEVFNRTSMVLIEGMPHNAGDSIPGLTKMSPSQLLSFKDWVKLGHMNMGRVTIPWCQIWLNIEPDGFIH